MREVNAPPPPGQMCYVVFVLHSALCYDKYMRKTFRYRLYPAKGQKTRLRQILESCRQVYNRALEARHDAWQQSMVSLSRYDTSTLLTQWKQTDESLQEGHAQALQDALMRVDLAFRAFFRRVKAGEKPGYPRFKSRDRYDSFTYPQEKGNWRFTPDGRLHLSKIGDVRIVLHRPLEGMAKTLTIRRDAVGNWYACFSCIVEPASLAPTDKVVGVDVGLAHFATLSNGEQIANPRFFRRDEKALVKAQRKLSKSEKGTPERRKRKRAVQHIHQRIANCRRDFAHQQARKLVNTYQLIVFEDLDIQGLQNGGHRGLNKSIADAAWHQLVTITTSKAEGAGRRVLLVDPRNTTQLCSGCGEVVRKGLSVRVHVCPHCGLILDRDHNAALNILARGLTGLGESP